MLGAGQENIYVRKRRRTRDVQHLLPNKLYTIKTTEAELKVVLYIAQTLPRWDDSLFWSRVSAAPAAEKRATPDRH